MFSRHLTHLGYDFERNKELEPGPYVVEDRKYFDGGVIACDLARGFVKATNKDVPVKYLQMVDIEEYSRVSDLPFARELQ